jgi:hypothetical protein
MKSDVDMYELLWDQQDPHGIATYHRSSDPDLTRDGSTEGLTAPREPRGMGFANSSRSGRSMTGLVT